MTVGESFTIEEVLLGIGATLPLETALKIAKFCKGVDKLKAEWQAIVARYSADGTVPDGKLEELKAECEAMLARESGLTLSLRESELEGVNLAPQDAYVLLDCIEEGK